MPNTKENISGPVSPDNQLRGVNGPIGPTTQTKKPKKPSDTEQDTAAKITDSDEPGLR